MAINKKLIHFRSKSVFNQKLANNELLDTSIVFIQDTQEIWTHGQIYKCNNPDLSEYLTADDLEELTTTISSKANQSDLTALSETVDTLSDTVADKVNASALNSYYTKTESDNKYLTSSDTTITSIQTDITNLKNVGAEANVQSDWNVTTTTSDAYIKNKPDLSVYLKSSDATTTYAPISLVDKVTSNETAITTKFTTPTTKTLAGFGITDGINTVSSSGTGNFITSVAIDSTNKHQLNITKGNVDLSGYATTGTVNGLNTSLSSLTGTVNTLKDTTVPAISNRVTTLESYFATAEDTDDVINKWTDVVEFLDGISEGNTEGERLASILETKANKANLDTTNTNLSNLTSTVNSHINNSSVSKSGETLTVKIGGTSQSLTNTWRSISDATDGTSSTISASQKAVAAAYTLANTANTTADTVKAWGNHASAGYIKSSYVGNGTVTIKQNGTSKGTFTMNQSGNTTIELTDTNTDTNTTYSAGTGLSLSGTTFSADGSAIINSLGEGSSPATRDDYIVAQYAAGGTTTTTYHRRKLSNIFAALNKSDITTALGYTPPTTNTTYSLVGAQNSTGLIKNGSSVTSTSGLTACPIINGIPYYKDTNTTYTLSSLGIGNVKNYDQSKAIKAITRSGTTFTYTCLDGTTGTFTQQDNNTTYSAATTSADGLMTSAMVTKLNGIASGATAVSSSTVSGWGFTKNAGTITGVTAGNGLTGGGTSGSVTLNIGAGTGITVNADTVEMNSTYRTYCTNGNSAWASYGTATSVASVPINYKLVKCTISAAGSFTLASTPAAGREVHVLIYNSSSADVVVSLPTASPYVNFSGDSLTVPATGYAEINVISDGSTMFIRHAA